jgi:hypothetical protein
MFEPLVDDSNGIKPSSVYAKDHLIRICSVKSGAFTSILGRKIVNEKKLRIDFSFGFDDVRKWGFSSTIRKPTTEICCLNKLGDLLFLPFFGFLWSSP